MANPIPFNQQNYPYQPNTAQDGFYSGGQQQQQQWQAPVHQQQQFHQYQQPQQPQQSGAASGQNLFNELSGNNPMAGYAMNQASTFLQSQSKLYLPGAYGYWSSLRYYFILNNKYVLTKLKILLLPFMHKEWRRIPLNETTSTTVQYAPPENDINAPDLYIPLMSFVTYILIAGYVKGSAGEFSPDIIGQVGSYSLMMQMLELGMIKFGLYLLNSSVSFLDLVAFTGYKYVGLVINMTVRIILGYWLYYVSLVYTGVAIAYFMLNCMKGSIPEPPHEGRKRRNYMLIGIAALQFVLIWWNAYT